MACFGQNPFGENLWRIVHAPSRRCLVHEEGRKPKWLPAYPQAGNCWVLEKWLSAYEFTKCTPELWNSTMTFMGPYPSRGEYELAHIFESVPAADANIGKIISWIEAGKRHSANENRNSIREDLAREEKARQSYWHDRLMDRTHAFGTAAFVGYGGGRGTKTREFPLTAESAGLPQRPGSTLVKQGRKQYDVSHLIEA